MKKMSGLFFLLLTGLLSATAWADVTFRDVKTYTGFWGNGATTKVVFRIDVLTPEGVYYGEYAQDGYTLWLGNIPNTVWTGPGSAPTMNITHQSNTVDNSNCPGITDGWSCVDLGVDIIVHGETHGCPWLVSTNTVSTAARGYTYIGPSAKQTRCPTEPVGPYDISWNENYVLHNKMLTLQSTGSHNTNALDLPDARRAGV